MTDRGAQAAASAVLSQWDDWLAAATDRLMQLDERVTAITGDPTSLAALDVAAAFVCRKAIAARVDELRADPGRGSELSARPVVDDRGDAVGANLADAAALLQAVLDKVERELTATETAHRTLAEHRISAHDDLAVARRLADDLGHHVQRCAAAERQAEAAGASADAWRAVAAEARAIRTELERLATLRTSSFERWRTLPEHLEGLAAREVEVRAIVDRSRAKVRPLPTLAIPSVAALGAPRPLAELESMTWPSARAVMEPYLTRIDRLGAAFDQVAQRFGGVLARRDELRGLLHAYRDKAAAVGLGEDAALEPLLRTAEGELWSAPCDVERAEELVRRYTEAVNARIDAAGGRPRGRG